MTDESQKGLRFGAPGEVCHTLLPGLKREGEQDG